MTDLLTPPARKSTDPSGPARTALRKSLSGERVSRVRGRLWGLVRGGSTEKRPARGGWAGGAAAGATSALASAVVCVLVMLVAELGAGSGSVLDAATAGLLAWLIGHGSGLRTGVADITAVPLGVTVLLGWCSFAIARRVRTGTRRRAPWTASMPALAGTVAGFAAAYGGVLVALAGSAELLGFDVHSLRALAGAIVLAGVSAAAGLVGIRTADDRARRTLPFGLLAALRGAVAGCLVMLLGSVIVYTAALVLSAGQFVDLTVGLEPTWPGALMLAATCLLALPNLLGLTSSVLLGPGFALGSDTTVTATTVSLGTVPGWPPLAALPASGPTPGWAVSLLLVPVLAGIAAGWLAAASSPGAAWRRISAAVGAGLLAGMLVAGWAVASGGSIGPGRMSAVGAAFSTLPIAVATLGAGGLIGGCIRLLAAGRPPG